MPPLPRISVLVIAFVISATACSSETATTTTSLPVTTTTSSTTTSPPVTTTTSAVPSLRVRLTSDLPRALEARVAEFYRWLADREEPVPAMPAGFRRHVEDVRVEGGAVLDATGVLGSVADQPIAIVHVGDDVLLAVKPAASWRIVGGRVGGTSPWLLRDVRTLLVLGSDARIGQNQQRLRADSIHVLTMAPSEEAGAIVGIPRDSWVEGPNGGTKFTNVMAGRGPEAMLEVARELTDLPIEGYVVTGFQGFESLIAVLGGLKIELPTRMRTGNRWRDFDAGHHDLDPGRALQLARIRKGLPGGDLDRSFNHGLIIQAAMEMVQPMGIDSLPFLLDALLDNAWTDLTPAELLTWGAAAFLLPPESFENVVVEADLGRRGAASVVYLTDESADVFADAADGTLSL